MTKVRKITPDDWPLWRALRQEALRESPNAFGSRMADWNSEGDREERWRARLESVAANFVAEVDGGPAGLVSGGRADGRDAELVSLWVAPSARGRGLGDRLVRAVVDWATADPSVEQIGLDVCEDNGAAQDLYRRHGFRFSTPATGRPGAQRRMTLRLPARIRIGVHSGQQYPDFATAQRLWHEAERLGYDWVSLFDHYRPPISGPDGPCLDGPSLLSALAATTPRVRCALMVAPPFWRHPALTAVIAATVDQVSGGRLELGVGVGGADLAFAQYGLEQPPLATRYEQLDETCQVLRLLWAGGPADFTGRHYRLRAAYLNPRPVQRRLPLLVGGAGRRRTLPLVARHADGWNCAVLAPDAYAEAAREVDDLCRAQGRDPHDIRRSITFRCLLTATPKEAAGARSALEARGHGADLPEYVSFGSAQECLDRLAPYAGLGVRDFLLGVRPPVDYATIERFAAEVAPVLRRVVAA
jgi:alkanesulfonate monooxygenase SsuD/methylene tetrahydromethanopterin reductase-like flavin-dependent oxidoreductase (luciferase family)/ribosomal protein S18 acetylase RimI-like enzyme